MPDGSHSDLKRPADVLLLSAEDGPADTIRPRLDALEADEQRISIPRENRHFLIPSEASLILDALRQNDAKLCVIDPLAAFLDATVNSWNNQHVRRALTPLADIAQQTGAAILIIDHLNKRSGIPAVHRGSGSIGFNATARSVLLACKHPQEPETFVLSSIKANLCASPPSLSYRTVQANNGVLKLDWLGECPYDADELVTAAFEPVGSRKLEAAKDLLRTRLASGSALSKVVEREAAEHGIAPRTLFRARKELGVISQPSGLQGEWVISLPLRSPLPR
jgi:AAA domain